MKIEDDLAIPYTEANSFTSETITIGLASLLLCIHIFIVTFFESTTFSETNFPQSM